MSDTEQILDRFTTKQGWDRDTQLDLALRYIETQGDPAGWEDFLVGIAETENAEDAIGEAESLTHLEHDRTYEELLRHLDVGHGIDPNTIVDDDDIEEIHVREHKDGTSRAACDRHGGPWGEDETCARCTYQNGSPRPINDPGPLGPGHNKNNG